MSRTRYMIEARVKAEAGARAARSAVHEIRHLVDCDAADLHEALRDERAALEACTPAYTPCWYAHGALIRAYEARAAEYTDQIARLDGWVEQMAQIGAHFATDPLFRA